MEPVRVRVYGLFPMTRRRYLAQAGVALIGVAAALAAWWLVWPALEERTRAMSLPPAAAFAVAVVARAPYVLLTAAAAQAVEAAFVLRRFARKKAAAPPPPQP